MQPEDAMRVGHILDAAAKVARWMRGVSLQEFKDDEKLQSAVVYAIQVGGEASNHLSDGFKAALPTLPWGDVVGMRNRIVHGYYLLDHRIVGDVAMKHLPDMATQLLPFAPAEEE
ncbi:MAG: DUF86 domain-containing protein [Planctomycetes bacterium]|nr:DUF86 domain-containing protein [Planctomycetota bacterium]MCW8135022.1 DUF86 domain-containing protein [Planctomycetota bacterium]